MFAAYTESVASPFPVSKMPHDYHEALIFFSEFIKDRVCFGNKFAMLHHIFFRNGECFKCFKKKVAEITIKPPFYFLNFFRLFIRK